MKHLLMLSAIIGITVLSPSVADSQTGIGGLVENTAAMIHATSGQTSPVRTRIGTVEVDDARLHSAQR